MNAKDVILARKFGGGGGGTELEAGAFAVTVTDNNGTLTADKTYAEIIAAINSGRTVYLYNNSQYLPVTLHDESIVCFGTFEVYGTEISSLICCINSDNSVEEISDNITVPSAVTDDHINSLIDTKLGVIENGSY